MISFLCLVVVVVCLIYLKSHNLCIPFPVSICKGIRNKLHWPQANIQSPSPKEAQFSKLFFGNSGFSYWFGVASS
ncbi:hypothetical protein HDV64DRAFT_244038 [Trichoderma sp. TUCIM 5745]